MLNADILRYFIQNLNLDKLVLKLKSHRIYSNFCSRINIWKCLQRIWHHYFNIIYLKYKFGQIGPKIKASLNLHEYSHTRQFEDSKCKYDNKRIFKFKSKFEKMFIQYTASERSVSKFTLSLNWPLLITNPAFNLKIFENALSHLHGNYKQIYRTREILI